MAYSENFKDIGTVYMRRSARREARFIYKEVFERGDYLRHGIDIPTGATIVDVGANIGFFSLFALLKAGEGARLLAFEPIPETFALLHQNLQDHLNMGTAEIFLENKGVTHLGGPESFAFTYFPNLPGNSTQLIGEKDAQASHMRKIFTRPRQYFNIVNTQLENRALARWIALLGYPLIAPLGLLWVHYAFGRRETLRCPLVPLGQSLQAHGITTVDLLKIDTEGAELDVLDGLTDADWPNIRQVVLEVQDTDNRLSEIKSRLKAAGFTKVEIDIAEDLSALSHTPIAMVYARRNA